MDKKEFEEIKRLPKKIEIFEAAGFKLYHQGRTTLDPDKIYLTIRCGLSGIYTMINTWKSGDWEGQVLDGSRTIYYTEFEKTQPKPLTLLVASRKTLEAAQEMYEEGLAACDGGGSEEYQKAYDNLIYRLQDLESLKYDQVPDLTFDDYVDR